MSDAPPVPHALNCACNACCAARAAEARRRIEEVRRAHAIAAREEEAGRGQVFKPLKKPPRGSLRALVRHSRRRAS